MILRSIAREKHLDVSIERKIRQVREILGIDGWIEKGEAKIAPSKGN